MMPADAQRSLREAVALFNAKRPTDAVTICDRVMPALMTSPEAMSLGVQARSEPGQL